MDAQYIVEIIDLPLCVRKTRALSTACNGPGPLSLHTNNGAYIRRLGKPQKRLFHVQKVKLFGLTDQGYSTKDVFWVL